MRISSTQGSAAGENTASENKICTGHCGCGRGLVRVIGIGPGHEEEMTPKAAKAIEDSEIIVGYNTYIALIRDRIGDRPVVGNGMRQEVERCQKAVELAAEGKKSRSFPPGIPACTAWRDWCWNWRRKCRKTFVRNARSFPD